MPRRTRTAPTSPFRMLPVELLNVIVDYVRRDDVGNETVPGHVSGAQLRGAAKFLRDTSDALTSEFDGDWYYQTYEHGFVNDYKFTAINSFKGGKRFTELPTAPVENDSKQLYIVRKPSTGAVKALMTHIGPGQEVPQHMDVKPRDLELSLKGLAQMLSSHNAEIDKRLLHFDEVTMGKKEVRVANANIHKTLEEQSVNGFKLVSNEYQGHAPFTGRIIAEDVMFGYTVVRQISATGTVKHTLSARLGMMERRILFHGSRHSHDVPIDLKDNQPGEPINVRRTAPDQKRGTLSPLTVVFGYYDKPLVAECRHARRFAPEPARWLISLYRIPASVVQEKPTWANPSAGLRTRAQCAILSVDPAIEITVCSDNGGGEIVVRRSRTPAEEAEHERRVSLYKRGGPAAAVARPRASAEHARAKMKPLIAEDNVTFNSGRKFAHTQPWDERVEEEAGKWVDDQYATARAEGESAGDDEDEDDAEYVPKRKLDLPPSKPPPDVNRLRRFVVISDDDDEEEEEEEAPAPPPPSAFRASGMRVLDAIFDD